MDNIKGVVAVLIGPKCQELANAADFSRVIPGGFNQEEAQEHRARDSLALAAMKNLASPILSDAIDSYDARQILSKMCTNGCRVIVTAIGYDDDKCQDA